MVPHLAARDTTMVAVSRAPLSPSSRRSSSGWAGPSTGCRPANNDFNGDYGVSFTQQQIEAGRSIYNFGTTPFYSEESPGISVFYRDEAGEIFSNT